MLRKVCRTVTVAALAAAAVTAAGEASSAAEDVTCTVATVLAPAVPRLTLAVGEVYGDGYVAEAVAACAAPAAGNVSGTLAVWYEYQPYDGASFQRVPGCGEVSVSGGGAYGTFVLASPPMVCSSFGQPWARRPVRAHAVFALTDGSRQYHGYSVVL